MSSFSRRRETADLAQVMIKLVDIPQLRNQLGTQARQWALKELTYTKMAAKTQQLYDDLLNPKYPNDNQNHKHAGD